MRHPHWPERLEKTLTNWRTRPFCWGKSDCVHFARDVLDAVQGLVLMARLPSYSSLRTAHRALQDLGFRDLSAAVTAHLGRPLPPMHTQRGDLVALPTPAGVALGVCLGAKAAAPGPHGLVFCPMKIVTHGWRV